MGFKRFLKKALIPGYYEFDIIQKVRENGVLDGIKEKMKEDYLEDTPVVSHIYNAGKYEGKKEGYAKASYVYEEKLLKQAEEFLNQKNEFANQKQEYEKLINEYERYIEEMSAKDSLSYEEKEYLNKIMIIERKLKNQSAVF